MQFEIKNIKISLKVHAALLNNVEEKCLEKNLSFNRKNNFLVVNDQFVYTIFLLSKNNTNHVNITKIPELSKTGQSIRFLSEKLGLKICKETYKVDNITASLNLGYKISLLEIIKKYQEFSLYWDGEFTFSYCNEKFPGLFIKLKQLERKIGTIIIFSTGKVVFVGCKSVDDIQCLTSSIVAFTKMK